MTRSYTARYTRIESGYMGQLVEWPEVVTEGANIEECRSMLRDALQEMTLAYQQLAKGGNHSIYTNDSKTLPVKRHAQIDRITANEICKQAGLPPRF